MNIYNYAKETKEYLSTSLAEADPEASRRQGKFVPLMPACSTLVELPAYNPENSIPVFEGGEWVVKPDYRKNFYKVDDNFFVDRIKTIGEQEGVYIVDKATGEAIKENPAKFKIEAGQVVRKSEDEYETEQAVKERERVMNLSLTKADVLLALYQDKGLSPDDIKAMLKDNIPALIKFDYASSYYRGDEVVIALGTQLGYSSDEMDYLFENKTFPPKIAEEAEN